MGNVVTAAALEAMEKVAEQAASEGSREEVGGRWREAEGGGTGLEAMQGAQWREVSS